MSRWDVEQGRLGWGRWVAVGFKGVFEFGQDSDKEVDFGYFGIEFGFVITKDVLAGASFFLGNFDGIGED